MKVLRVRLGVTRAALAGAIGVDPVTVWRWETGKTNSSRSPGVNTGLAGGAGVPSAVVEYLRGVALARVEDAASAAAIYAPLTG